LSDLTWSEAQLDEVANAEELVLVISRPERAALRFPVWTVVVGGAIYVRSYRGVTNGWYRAVVANPQQAIVLGSGDVEIRFEFVQGNDAVNEPVSAAFVLKYANDEYRDSMIEPMAIGATLRILPR